MGDGTENWSEYRRLVLSEFERMHTENRALSAKIDQLVTDVAVLKMKAGVWGAVSGTVAAIGTALIAWMARGGR